MADAFAQLFLASLCFCMVPVINHQLTHLACKDEHTKFFLACITIVAAIAGTVFFLTIGITNIILGIINHA